MKNVVIGVLLLTTVVGLYIAATSTLRLGLAGLTGKTDRVIRGDLTIPIDATGEVKSARRIEVKAEASGEVVEIARMPGERVRAGEVLIRLRRDDEQRNVNRAKLNQNVARAKLEEARLRLRQSETADVDYAQAQVKQLEGQVRLAKFRLDKLTALPDHQRNDEEMLQRETTHQSQVAQFEAAKANLEKARLAIPRAKQAIIQAESTYETAKNNLGDAEKVLSKTDIVSPLDGIVADIRVQIGEVIQGGKTTLTGGTVLAVLFDLDQLIVRAEVDESDIGRVLKIAPKWALPGREATVRIPSDLKKAVASMEHLPVITVESFREEEFTGVIERLYPEPRVFSGVVTYLVDVVITSDNRNMLLPGMRADVRFTSEHVTDVVLCPNEAIREGPGGKLGVYVPKKDALPDERATEFLVCQFGLDNGSYSEVRAGLEEGTVVYTKLPRTPARKNKKERR